MDRGIRPAVNRKFVELLPQRAEMGDKKFRRTIMDYAMEEFGTTNGGASAHYNFAFKQCKEANPELVLGLGRADDKKGGRKHKVVATVVPADPYFAAHADAIFALAVVQNTPAAVEVAVDAPAEQLYTVTRVKDGVVIFSNMSKAEADEVVAKAAKGKKAKLAAVAE